MFFNLPTPLFCSKNYLENLSNLNRSSTISDFNNFVSLFEKFKNLNGENLELKSRYTVLDKKDTKIYFIEAAGFARNEILFRIAKNGFELIFEVKEDTITSEYFKDLKDLKIFFELEDIENYEVISKDIKDGLLKIVLKLKKKDSESKAVRF